MWLFIGLFLFIWGISGLFDGGYDEDIDELKDRIKDLENKNH